MQEQKYIGNQSWQSGFPNYGQKNRVCSTEERIKQRQRERKMRDGKRDVCGFLAALIPDSSPFLSPSYTLIPVWHPYVLCHVPFCG